MISAEIDITRGQAGMELPPLFPSGLTFLGHEFGPTDKLPPYFVMLALLLACLAALTWLARSRFGLFVRALREDEDAAAALGVNTTRYKVLVFTVTTGMAAAAGAVQAHYVGIVTPNLLFLLQMSLVVAMAVIGGLENFFAAAIGAILLQFALEMLRNNIFIGGLRDRHDGLAAGVLRRPADGHAALLPQRPDRAADQALHARRRGEGDRRPPRRRRGARRMIHLSVRNLHKRYGGLHVLKGVSFEVKGPELIGLIGPNGAGKTTLTNVLDGAVTPSSGTVYLNGERIDQLKPYEVARAGLGRTFQVTRAFRRMTVLENLAVPALAMGAANRAEVREKSMEVLEFLTLDHLRNEYAQALSGGQQKLLELGRLLMLDPDVVILDEPFAGVHPRLMEVIYAYIRRVNEAGKAIIIISHQMDAVFSLSQRLLVLNFGDLIADGHPDAVKRDPTVIEAYLGSDEEDAA